jgi:hypothetical protein
MSFFWKIMKGTAALILSLLISASGCSWIGQEKLVIPNAQGRIQSNVYTSPSGTFRLQIPRLSNPTIREEVPSPNTMLLSITDDLCREFIVSERPGFLGADSLESWVNTHIVRELKSLGFDVQSQPVSTRYGPAISLRYRAPTAAPCTQEILTEGKRVETKRDADIGWYVFNRSGVFYRLIYVMGLGPGVKESWFIQREPVDQVLAQFVDGFEIVGAKEKRN